jgi:hypothetical protein
MEMKKKAKKRRRLRKYKQMQIPFPESIRERQLAAIGICGLDEPEKDKPAKRLQ